jgi:hypothetical protein
MENETFNVGRIVLSRTPADDLRIALAKRPEVWVEIPMARLERWANKIMRDEILVATKVDISPP